MSNVKNVTIWGNHSSTQFPDVINASVQSSGKSASVYESINDSQWLEGDFIKVRKYITLIYLFNYNPFNERMHPVRACEMIIIHGAKLNFSHSGPI